MQEYKLFRNAQVEVNPVITNSGIATSITVNDKIHHTFEPSSRISKALSLTNGTESLDLATRQLQDRLSGGTYFTINDELVDFRDSHYHGFIHSDNSIEQLMHHIGVDEASSIIRSGLRLNTTASRYTLTNKYSTESFQLANALVGGEFDSSVIYSWNPFTSFVRAAFEIVRLVCANGAVSTTELVNSRIPLLNRWQEHLDISNLQMQNSIKGIAAKRFDEMVESRAGVGELKLIAKHASARIDDGVTIDQRKRLERIRDVVDPMIHLTDYYSQASLVNSNIAAQLPSHLSSFDAWNCVTEILTHTSEVDNSSTGSLLAFANRLLFPTRESNSNHHLNTTPLLSSFSSPDVAFFG